MYLKIQLRSPTVNLYRLQEIWFSNSTSLLGFNSQSAKKRHDSEIGDGYVFFIMN